NFTWTTSALSLLNATTMPEPLQSFHDRGFEFACAIVRLYAALIKVRTVPAFMARQLLRSGTSIGANLEEAKGAQSRRDVTAKFSIALKEARETLYWLRLIAATSLAPLTLVSGPLKDAREMTAILTAARRNLDTKG